jgi:D-alanyl-D-alanine carboxypeptidase
VKRIFKNITSLSFFIILCLVVVGASAIIILNHENTALKSGLKASHDQVVQITKEKTDLENALQDAANKNQNFASQLTQVTNTVNQLQWLRNLDPQLLQKYSKVYFLNENYTPKELSPIDSKYLLEMSRTILIHDRVLPFVQQMLQAAASNNITILVDSGYRSFETQKTLKSSYRVTYGSGANSFSADQGYSEHQLGTALDFTTRAVGGELTGYEKTTAYSWMVQNAYKYGFSLSFPPNNKYYIYEPWHWRFVGVELATRLHNENKYFFELDQRDIDPYLADMFTMSTSTSQ